MEDHKHNDHHNQDKGHDHSHTHGKDNDHSHDHSHDHEHGHDHEHKNGHDDDHKPDKIQFRSFRMDRAFAFNPKKGEKGTITYTITEPARISIKTLKKGTRELYLSTILNWEERTAGTHTEYWDGKDYEGNIIEDLSEFMIVMEGEPMSTFKPGEYSVEGLTDEEIVHGHKWGHPHNYYQTDTNVVPDLAITSVNDGDVLSGVVTVNSHLKNEESRGYGDKVGYGVRHYLNNILVSEEFYDAKCKGNFSCDIDTTAFPDGEYTLYVGMCDHHQHATSRGCKITLKNNT